MKRRKATSWWATSFWVSNIRAYSQGPRIYWRTWRSRRVNLSPTQWPEHEWRQPDNYGFCNLFRAKEPESVGAALKGQECSDSMKGEIGALHDHDMWELVELQAGWKPVGSKWIFKVKINADGSVEWCKAHLVAQGYSQEGTKFLVQSFDQSLFIQSLVLPTRKVRSCTRWT